VLTPVGAQRECADGRRRRRPGGEAATEEEEEERAAHARRDWRPPHPWLLLRPPGAPPAAPSGTGMADPAASGGQVDLLEDEGEAA
jgi:hypothetical protein